jgi:hypothetical protein
VGVECLFGSEETGRYAGLGGGEGREVGVSRYRGRMVPPRAPTRASKNALLIGSGTFHPPELGLCCRLARYLLVLLLCLKRWNWLARVQVPFNRLKLDWKRWVNGKQMDWHILTPHPNPPLNLYPHSLNPPPPPSPNPTPTQNPPPPLPSNPNPNTQKQTPVSRQDKKLQSHYHYQLLNG